jgi:sulfatase modifying factor 1
MRLGEGGIAMKTLGAKLLLPCVLLVACDSVIGISEPEPRPDPKGASGAGGANEQGGEGGEAGSPSTPNGAASGESGAAGEGGRPTVSNTCVQDERRCGGDAMLTPEVCSDSGEWVADVTEAAGAECPERCVEGRCVECLPDERKCDGRVRQSCEEGRWEEQELCKSVCNAGSCVTPPSCSPALECGDGQSCCQSPLVPGGKFSRDYDKADYDDPTYEATISSFLLDTFEVTVARMKKFVAAYDEIVLDEGAGKAPHIGADVGWRKEYKEHLPATAEELVEGMVACADHTWADDFSNDRLPINCVSFYVAYAFCIWDGGRLPTEAEWNYAAAGGNEQRVYPWFQKAAENDTNPDRAYFDQLDGLPIAVGSRPAGAGRWGHQDLAGNVFEWTLDFYGDYPETCVDCLNVTAAEWRVKRGGGYLHPIESLVVAARWAQAGDFPSSDVGFRCARDLK